MENLNKKTKGQTVDNNDDSMQNQPLTLEDYDDEDDNQIIENQRQDRNVDKKSRNKVKFNDDPQQQVIKIRKVKEFQDNEFNIPQIEDKQNQLDFEDDDFELGTDRNNFNNLDTDRGMISKRVRQNKQDLNGELELKKLSTKSNRRSFDTRATENNFNIPDLPNEDDSLVEDEESSIFDNSFKSNEQRKSMIQKQQIRGKEFDQKLVRMQQISEIDHKLKKAGVNRESIMKANPKRNCLDRLSVPRKVALKIPCCKFRVSFFFCVFCIFIMDCFILLKDLIQMSEMVYYKEDYPQIVAIQNSVKTALISIMVFIEGYFVLRKKIFNFCKMLYALKILQVIVVFYHIFVNKDLLEEQCNNWLKNPTHGLYRDSRDTNGHRPMTMLYNCNFERVYEDKNKKQGEVEIRYFTFNYTIQKVLNSIEIVYCIICMGLYLLVIYWNQEDSSHKIILGKKMDDFLSDEEDKPAIMDDHLYEAELFEYKMQQNRQMQNMLIDMKMNKNTGDSRIDYSTFSSFNNNIASDKIIDQEYLQGLNKHQRTMNYDSVYHGPSQSRKSRIMQGKMSKDVRWQLSQQIRGVNAKIDYFDKKQQRPNSGYGAHGANYQIQSFNQFVKQRRVQEKRYRVEQQQIIEQNQSAPQIMMGDENSSDIIAMSGKKKKRELYDEEGLGFETQQNQEEEDDNERDKLETDIHQQEDQISRNSYVYQDDQVNDQYFQTGIYRGKS